MGGGATCVAFVLPLSCFSSPGRCSSWPAVRAVGHRLQGDELIIPFDGGEIRFSRLIPPNSAGLRAFPLQRATDAEPTYDEGQWLQRGPILLKDGCLRVGVSDSMFTSYLIMWLPQYAVAFDDEAAWATWPDVQTV